MSEIEKLKNIAIEKDEEVRKLKEIGQTQIKFFCNYFKILLIGEF